MAIRMRRGLESELDISKAVPGEWLVSTDTRYVRMCFAPGIVLRMATYEAFEADMEQIQSILAEAKTVEEAIQKIYEDVQQTVIDIEIAQNSAHIAIEKSTEARESAEQAAESETNANNAANSARESEKIAIQKANEASEDADSAYESELNAANSAAIATEKATEASNSEKQSNNSANRSEEFSAKSQSYAVGGTGTRENEETDNAKYYYEQAKHISQGGNGLVPLGTIAFENLPTEDILTNAMYNISNDFTSDERFLDGGGILYGKGSNIFYTADGYWDVLAASDVKGVKGEAEDTFRQGNVNITRENIGLGNVDNTADANKSVKYATDAENAIKATQDSDGNQINTSYLKKTGDSKDNTVTFTSGDSSSPTGWAGIDTIVSGEKHSSLFYKLSLVIRNARYLYKMLGTTDISTIGDGTVTGAIDVVNTDIFINKGVVSDIDDVNMSPAVHATNNNTAGTFPDNFTKAGFVEHIKRTSAHFIQRYTELNTAPRMAVRIYINGAWSLWQEITNKSDLNVFNTAITGLTNDSGKLYRLVTRASGNTISFDWAVTNNQRYLDIYIDNVLVDKILPLQAMLGQIQINFAFSNRATDAGMYVSNSVFMQKGFTFNLTNVNFVGSVGNFASQIQVQRNGNYIYLTANNSAFAGLIASCIGTVS